MWASFARAVRCYRLYGDIIDEFAPDRNYLARERALGNEVAKDRSVISNLTLSSARGLLRRASTSLGSTCMRAANGLSLPRALPAIALSRYRRFSCLSGDGVSRIAAYDAPLYNRIGPPGIVAGVTGARIKRTNPIASVRAERRGSSALTIFFRAPTVSASGRGLTPNLAPRRPARRQCAGGVRSKASDCAAPWIGSRISRRASKSREPSMLTPRC